ncbi:MAG TPA: TetR family transcriptional regulator [Trebonia sp.]
MVRRYELKQRAQRQAETRQRILEAAVALHVERGPAATQITDIAQRAGVDRVTIYRHFPDLASLFKACSAHYYSARPLPDPNTWAAIQDPRARLRHGLREIYAYWAQNAAAADHILRDAQTLGHLGVGKRLQALQHHAVDVLAKDWSPPDQTRPELTATIRVAVDFHTWQRLVDEQGLPEQDAVELAVTWTQCVASTH